MKSVLSSFAVERLHVRFASRHILPGTKPVGLRRACALFKRKAISCALLVVLTFTSACERAFVPESAPEIDVVSPDLSTALTESAIPIRISATSFRPVDHVELGGEPLAYNEQTGGWQDTLHLQTGLNTFVVEAYDRNGVRGIDTLEVIYLPLKRSDDAPALPAPRGGHTATLLPGGDLLVTGGAPQIGGAASPDAWLLSHGQSALSPLPSKLTVPRTDHTATLLPDGRVLILGGARADSVHVREDLIADAELYDPATRQFKSIPVSGDPVRRVRHTTVAYASEGEVRILVHGGLGVIHNDPTPEPLASLNRYVFRNDSLIAVGARIGFLLPEPAVGHTMTELPPFATSGLRRYLVAGSFFWRSGPVTDNFVLDVFDPGGIDVRAARSFLIPRTRHADAELLRGFVAVHGGIGASASELRSDDEVYVDTVGRFFYLPRFDASLKRFGHTATKLPSQRILVLGGFGMDGNGITESEYLILESE